MSTSVVSVVLEAQSTKQFVTIEQVAALTVFLCSGTARSITSADTPIDGETAH